MVQAMYVHLSLTEIQALSTALKISILGLESPMQFGESRNCCKIKAVIVDTSSILEAFLLMQLINIHVCNHRHAYLVETTSGLEVDFQSSAT